MKEKRQALLTDIGEKLYMKKMNTKLPPLKNLCSRKKKQVNNDQFNEDIAKTSGQCCVWKLQANWNKLDWVVSINSNPQNNLFYQST